MDWLIDREKDDTLKSGIADFRREINALCDRSLLERVLRLERMIKGSQATDVSRARLESNHNESPLVIMCEDSLEKSDLDNAFLSVLRHLEGLSTTKADVEELSENATRDFVQKIFADLDTINNGRITDRYMSISSEMEARLQQIADSFEEFKRDIDSRMNTANADLEGINNAIIRYQ
jgi:hypothetical protein